MLHLVLHVACCTLHAAGVRWMCLLAVARCKRAACRAGRFLSESTRTTGMRACVCVCLSACVRSTRTTAKRRPIGGRSDVLALECAQPATCSMRCTCARPATCTRQVATSVRVQPCGTIQPTACNRRQVATDGRHCRVPHALPRAAAPPVGSRHVSVRERSDAFETVPVAHISARTHTRTRTHSPNMCARTGCGFCCQVGWAIPR